MFQITIFQYLNDKRCFEVKHGAMFARRYMRNLTTNEVEAELIAKLQVL